LLTAVVSDFRLKELQNAAIDLLIAGDKSNIAAASTALLEIAKSDALENQDIRSR
jgi:hypothetical protein